MKRLYQKRHLLIYKHKKKQKKKTNETGNCEVANGIIKNRIRKRFIIDGVSE